MSPDDPQFTAYALDALPPCERSCVEAEIWADSELRDECVETAAFAEKLKRALSIELNASLTESHWREIHAEAAVVGLPTRIAIPFAPRNQFPVWAFPAAAGILFGAVIASLALTWSDKPSEIASEGSSPQVEEAPALSTPEIPRSTKPLASGLPLISKFPTKETAPETMASDRSEILPAGVVMGSLINQPVFSSRRTLQILSEVPPALPNLNITESAGIADRENQTLTFPDPVFANTPSREASSLSLAASMMTPMPALYSIPPPSSGANGNVQPPAFSTLPTPSITQQAGTGGKGTKPSVSEKNNKTENATNQAATSPSEIAWRRSDEMLVSTTANGKDRSGVSVGSSSLDPMRLDTELYPTLDYLNVILERDEPAEMQRATTSTSSTATAEQFYFRDSPDVKVLVVLDNSGLPPSMTLGNTRVLSISMPFVVTP